MNKRGRPGAFAQTTHSWHATTSCSGCGRTFTENGLKKHLASRPRPQGAAAAVCEAMSELEVQAEYEPGDDTDDRIRRAIAILLGDRKGEREGEAA